MNRIVKIHERVLVYLIKLQKQDKDLVFVPRRNNNRQRLNKGYWFLGNEHYMHLSFWDGRDWKEKIHNIGFVILEDGRSYIELAAQDSQEKAQFLEEIIASIGGFTQIGSKNKWQRHFSGTDYIKNLGAFISSLKPDIDELVKSKRPKGIRMPDREVNNRHTQRIIQLRENQIEFGNNNKLSRICWNTEGWKFPSGSKGKSVSSDAYEAKAGYGHEEWLFDKSRIVDGYHYAFIQPLLLKTSLHYNKVYNISLFTINALRKQYYAGIIFNAECITKEESQRVYHVYNANGWLGAMQSDVKRVGADNKKFKLTDPKDFFNIRFKMKDVKKSTELVEIADDDINITTNHYKLLPQKSKFAFKTFDIDEDDEGTLKNTDKRKRVFNSECEFDPYHDQMQNAIFILLKDSQKYDYQKVQIEKGRVDIKAQTKDGAWDYFELKTENPKLSIRQALGQILEYAYFPDLDMAMRLIIVADEEPDNEVVKYLDHIRNKFKLPITYRYFNLESNILSEDY